MALTKIQLEVRKQFLNDFVASLIYAYEPPKFIVAHIEDPTPLQESAQIVVDPNLIQLSSPKKIEPSNKEIIQSIMPEKKQTLPSITQQRPVMKQQFRLPMQPAQRIQQRPMMAQSIPSVADPGMPTIPANMPRIQSIPMTSQTMESLGLGKIAFLLIDPAVQSLECPGPGKVILVNRSGLVQATNISLSSEDINHVMSEISKQTKIPVIPGVFKAILGNLLITAVVSDFVGTRFIIQKVAQISSQYMR